MIRLEDWVAADHDAVERCAESVVESLGPGWSLARDRAERPTFCNAEGFARFRYEGLPTSEFVLVPGGAARIGFDPETWEPSEALASFWEAVREGMPRSAFDRDLRDYIASVTSPSREVDLPALLVERAPVELGWERLAEDDPRVRLLVQRVVGWVPRPILVDRLNGEWVRLRGILHRDQQHWVVERALGTQHPNARELAARDGLRLLTEDEWEYAASGGRAELFSWGPDCPLHCYPESIPRTAFDTENHRNRFGLYMPTGETGEWELVDDPALRLGGDGAARSGGNAPFFCAWLTLSPSWRERGEPAPPHTDGAWLRRAREIHSGLGL